MVRPSHFLGLLCLQLSIHVHHCFQLERTRRRNGGNCRFTRNSKKTWHTQRRRRSHSITLSPLYMYAIEDNHDKRPFRRFSRTVTNYTLIENNDNSDNDDDNTMYHKKLENYYYENNHPKQPQEPLTKNKNDWQTNWGFEFHSIHDENIIHPRTIDTTKSTMNVDELLSNCDTICNYFPSTMDEVTDAVVATIAAVLQPQPSLPLSTKQSTVANSVSSTSHSDPNVLQNMVYSDNIMMSRRPVRHPKHDMGRIGIELDWSVPVTTTSATTTGENYEHRSSLEDHSTVRYASLLLAGKLSTRCFSKHSIVISKRKNSKIPPTPSPQQQETQALRPIVIYYNTVQQALVASRQLLQLKRLEIFRQQQENLPTTSSIYDTIYIRSLCQDIDIPDALINDTSDRHNISAAKLSRRLATGQMNPITAGTGMILIVQPTNYNDEFRPPGPSINVLESIQRLVSIAAIEQLPVIMISPRFLKGPQFSSSSASSASLSGHWDQSGYYQQSSLYAGLEPPPGPTPWILRDFTPPVFCYVANALSCKIPRDNSQHTSSDRKTYYRNMIVKDDVDGYSYYYSHLSLWQSVLHQGYGWNLFAAIRHVPDTEDGRRPQSSSKLNYEWIGTSKNAAGRPTRQFMRRVWNEYIDATTTS